VFQLHVATTATYARGALEGNWSLELMMWMATCILSLILLLPLPSPFNNRTHSCHICGELTTYISVSQQAIYFQWTVRTVKCHSFGVIAAWRIRETITVSLLL
jgi:hypothetical protein